MSEERKVQEVLARYVRATDQRDGKAQGALFTDEAVVQLYTKTGRDSYEPFGPPLVGGAGVEYAVTNFMSAHPEGGSSHHTTFESGYYDTDLRRVDGEWKIVKHSVLLDMPFAVPAAR
jgi:hypothetical protein